MSQRNTRILIAVGLILAAVVIRILNTELHLFHFAPVAAIGLFCGAIVRNKPYSFLFTVLTQLLSDIYFQCFTNTPGFYGVEQLFVYGGMSAVTWLGMFMGRPNVGRVVSYSVLGSLLFFIISNFGVWVSIQLGNDLYGYGKGLSGLATTYLMALPFYTKVGTELFGNALLGDILWNTGLFGAYSLLTKRLASATTAGA